MGPPSAQLLTLVLRGQVCWEHQVQAGWECQELHALAEVVLVMADPLVDWEVEVGCVVWLVMAEACKNIVDRELKIK